MRRVAAVVACIIALAGCRLDASVDVVMQPDGSGEVRVELLADSELIARITNNGANTLDDVLSFDDAVANGWDVSEPTTTADNHTQVVLVHKFAERHELANVLNSLGPPLIDAAASRTTEGDQTTNAVRGTLVLTNGYQAFADNDLVEAVGGLPFASELATSTPAETLSFTYRVDLPGELVTAGTGSDIGQGVIEWTAPLDGTEVELLMQTVQRPGNAGIWRVLSTIALVALVAWLVFAITLFFMVVRARRRRRRKRAGRAELKRS